MPNVLYLIRSLLPHFFFNRNLSPLTFRCGLSSVVLYVSRSMSVCYCWTVSSVYSFVVATVHWHSTWLCMCVVWSTYMCRMPRASPPGCLWIANGGGGGDGETRVSLALADQPLGDTFSSQYGVVWIGAVCVWIQDNFKCTACMRKFCQ